MRSRKFFGTIVRASVVHTKQDRLGAEIAIERFTFPHRARAAAWEAPLDEGCNCACTVTVSRAPLL